MTSSPSYEGAYLRLLESVSAYARPTRLAALWPIRGSLYAEGGLLSVGRAMNGWGRDGGWTPADLRTPEGRGRVLDDARATSDAMGGYDPDWAARSAYQRVARSVHVRGLGGSPADVDRRIAWSNLYRVAPHVAGNPAWRLRLLQDDAGAELLRLEVEALRPSVVLVLAGADWFRPFRERLGLRLEARGGLVEAVGEVGGARLVVAKHPARKPEGRIVEEVVAAIAAGGAST